MAFVEFDKTADINEWKIAVSSNKSIKFNKFGSRDAVDKVITHINNAAEKFRNIKPNIKTVIVYNQTGTINIDTWIPPELWMTEDDHKQFGNSGNVRQLQQLANSIQESLESYNG